MMEAVALLPIDPRTVTEAQRGDPQARERLLVESYRRIYRYHLRLTGGRAEESHDLAQETMVRLIRSLETLREPERFMPWALRIAVNLWRDRGARRPTAPLPLQTEAPPAEDPESDLAARVLASLRMLPEPYRSAVTLRYLEDLDYEAMSEILEISAVTLRSHVARALRMIRERCKE